MKTLAKEASKDAYEKLRNTQTHPDWTDKDYKVYEAYNYQMKELKTWVRNYSVDKQISDYEIANMHNIVNDMVRYIRQFDSKGAKIAASYRLLELSEEHEEIYYHLQYGQHADYLVEQLSKSNNI